MLRGDKRHAGLSVMLKIILWTNLDTIVLDYAFRSHLLFGWNHRRDFKGGPITQKLAWSKTVDRFTYFRPSSLSAFDSFFREIDNLCKDEERDEGTASRFDTFPSQIVKSEFCAERIFSPNV